MTQPPRTHDLMDLQVLCEKHDTNFTKIINQCINLTQYGVHVRYPNEMTVDENDAEQALADAQDIEDFEPIEAQRATVKAACTQKPAATQAITPNAKPAASAPTINYEQRFAPNVLDSSTNTTQGKDDKSNDHGLGG